TLQARRGHQAPLAGGVPMSSSNRKATVGTALFAANMVVAIGAVSSGHFREWFQAGLGAAPANAVETSVVKSDSEPGQNPSSEQIVELSDTQLASLKVDTVGEHRFPIEKSAVGSIDFNEEMSVQVFTPYQGRIISLFAKVSDEIKKGQPLFTID